MACGRKMWLLNDICQIVIAHRVVARIESDSKTDGILEINL